MRANLDAQVAELLQATVRQVSAALKITSMRSVGAADGAAHFVVTLNATEAIEEIGRARATLEGLRRTIQRQRVRVVRGDRCGRRRRR